MTSSHAVPQNVAPVETSALTVSYGSNFALREVSLTIEPGSIFALIGANGAGKTTLIKTLLNIIRPTSGTALVNGIPSTSVRGEALETIGYVSENQKLPGWMTVSQLMDYLRPFYPTWDRTLEDQLKQQLQIPEKRKISKLSRGQTMKTALLSVLPYRPSLIVLDEPFSGLDPLARDEFIEGLLQELATDQQEAPAVLISSHDLAEIESFATHVGFLDSGKLLFSESVETLSARFREVTVSLSQAQDAKASLSNIPASWLLPETGPSFSRFVHCNAATESIEDQVTSMFPGASNIQMEPMGLRSIFLALAKTNRASNSTFVERSRA